MIRQWPRKWYNNPEVDYGKPPSKYKQLTGGYKYTYDGNVPKY